MSAEFITTDAALADLCQRLLQSPWLALDTEFIRERTYYPQLCLIQIADPQTIACIDPLAVRDLGPLLDLLRRPEVTKVFHAAHQDLEILFALCGEVPGPVFDTQIAATLLGHGDQIGYANLVQAELGVQLDKSQSRTDWSHRPLSDAQLDYAADDVRYLRELYPLFLQRLADLGRSDWLAEDFAGLSDAERYQTHPEAAWQRVKGTNRLKGRQLAVLRALAAWREEEAIRNDRPRRWVMKDELLLDLARIMPEEREQASRIRGIDQGLMQRHGQTLFALIGSAKKSPKDEWPTVETGPRIGDEEEPLVDLLNALLRECCRNQKIAPGAVGGRRDLERLLLGDASVPLLHGWRREIVGNRLEALLAGQLALAIRDRRLAIVEQSAH